MSFRILIAAALVLVAAATARAQEPRPAPRDTLQAPADTTESAEELERRLIEELGRVDSMAPPEAPATAQAQSLNPNISLIPELLIDLSPEKATLEDGDRFQMREVELGVQGAVDPYFRYDAFLGLHKDGIEVEEAYATTLSLPAGLQAKLGKFHLPFGKVNLTHRPELHTIDYPLYIQEYFGEEGLSSTGVWLSVIGAPLGFYQELTAVATNGAEAEEAGGDVPQKKFFDDLADRLFIGHFKSSIDLTEAANLELGASAATSKNEEAGRTSLYGVDATWRWKPPQFSKYRSAILQAEIAWRDPDEGGTRLGAFAFGQWQLTRRTYAGARWDYVEPPLEEEIPSVQAGQVILRYFPTEFSQFRAVYERQVPDGGDALDRLLFQATFALGPHRPHAF